MIFFGYIDPGSGFTIFNLGAIFLVWVLGFLGFLGAFFKKTARFFKGHKYAGLAVLFLFVTLGVTAVVMNRHKPSPLSKNIILLGLDGLSPTIMEPMMAEGRLPNFSRLKESGAYDRLRTTNPPQSPVAWSAFSTGQNPGKNGIYDFIIRDPKNYELTLSMSNTQGGRLKKVIKGKRFWEYTSAKHIPSVILSCPITFPPDKMLGKMISGMGVPDVLGTEGTFTFYTTRLQDSQKDIGGNVFEVKKSPVLVMDLIGPKVAGIGKKSKNVTVPFKAVLKGDDVLISFQGRTATLKTGQWSGWQEVSFPLGPFKKMKGIFKFYLLETSPEFKLYISPINFDPREPYFPISTPPGYSKDLAGELGLYYTLGMPMETWALNEKRLDEKAFMEQVRVVSDDRRRLLHHELDRLKNSILFCYFEDPDIVQHMFWRYTDPQHPLYEKDAPAEYKDMIRTWYERLDGIVGEVMRKLGPEDLLFVFSDHGFDTFERTVHLNSWLRDNGFLLLRDDSEGEGAELLSDVDWSRTKAYAIGFGGIYLNLKGREGEGIVDSGEAESIKMEISSGLKKWTDEKNGRAVVHEVYKNEDIFQGPYADQMPDLYVGFNKAYQASWQTALGAAPSNTIDDNLKKWSGTHLFDPALIPGVIFSNRKIEKKDPSIYDLAPTVLKLSGYSDKDMEKMDMDGQALI